MVKREEKTKEELFDLLNRELGQLPDHEGTRFSSLPHRLSGSTATGRNWATMGNLLLGPGVSPDPKQIANLIKWAYREYNLPPEGSLQSK